jgi:hypothetical protein
MLTAVPHDLHDEPRRHVRAGLQLAECVTPAKTSSFCSHLPPQRGHYRDAQQDAHGGNDIVAVHSDRALARHLRRDPHLLRPPLEDYLRMRSPSPHRRRVSRVHAGASHR